MLSRGQRLQVVGYRRLRRSQIPVAGRDDRLPVSEFFAVHIGSHGRFGWSEHVCERFTRGRSNLERHLLGGVTERVIPASPVHLSTVRSGTDSPALVDREHTDILLPTHGGRGSELAVKHAIIRAARFNATLHVMYAVDVRSQATKDDIYGLETLVDGLRTVVIDAVIDRADAAGVDARAVIQRRSPHSAIQRYAENNGIDLTIVGTHGRGPVEQFLL